MLSWLQQLGQQMSQQISQPLQRPDPPKSRTSEARLYQIQLQGQTIGYHLRRSKRRSIGFMINQDGLHVTAPAHATQLHIEHALMQKQSWIISKLRETQNRPSQAKMAWQDGAQLPFLGQTLTLCVRSDAARLPFFDAERCQLHLRADERPIQQQVQRWLQNQARQCFARQLPLFAAQLGVQYQTFALSSARSRWGSCTSSGNIRLNWRLIHFDASLIDYVIAHELAHLCEMNHSPRFWATVARIYPNYAAARAALRQQAPGIHHLY